MIEKSQLFFKHCRVFLSVHLSIGTFPLLLTWCIQTGWHFFPWNITQPSAAMNGYIFRRLWDTDCRTLENLPGRSKGFEITTAIKQPTFRSSIWGTKVHGEKKKKHCILQQEPFSDQTCLNLYDLNLYANALSFAHKTRQQSRGCSTSSGQRRNYSCGMCWSGHHNEVGQKATMLSSRVLMKWLRRLHCEHQATAQIPPNKRCLITNLSARGKYTPSLIFSFCKPWK